MWCLTVCSGMRKIRALDSLSKVMVSAQYKTLVRVLLTRTAVNIPAAYTRVSFSASIDGKAL